MAKAKIDFNDPKLMELLEKALGDDNSMGADSGLQPSTQTQTPYIEEPVTSSQEPSASSSVELDLDEPEFSPNEYQGYDSDDDDFFSDTEPQPVNTRQESKPEVERTFSSPVNTPNIEMTSGSKTIDISNRGQSTKQTEQSQTANYEQDPVYMAQRQEIATLIEQQKVYQKQLEEAMGKIQTMQTFMQSNEQQSYNERAKQEIFDTEQDFENVISEPCTSSFMGQPFTYRRYEEEISFDRRFERGLSDDDTARNYLDFVEKITEDIENKFGGWDRVSTLAVVSNLLIINGVSYEPYLPEYYQEMLPFDVRNNLADGQFAWLFNFGTLRKMKNLHSLKFSDEGFVYSKVRKDLGIVIDFRPSSLFKVCRRLQQLQIGNACISANDPKSSDQLFHRASRCEKIYNSCMDIGLGATSYGWNSIKNVFHDPNRSGLSKIWGITWRGVGTAAAGAGTVGVKATGLVAKLGKGVANFASSLTENLK